MMFKLLFIGLLSAVFISASPTKAFSQKTLIVEGNVLGYELHEVKPFGEGGFIWIVYDYPVLVRVTKVTKGKEKSEYIIVLMNYLKKENAEKNFGINKTASFKVMRRTNYFLTIKDLLRKGLVLKNGKVEEGQTFTFVPEVDKKDLPLNKPFPVYSEVERNKINNVLSPAFRRL